MLQNPSALLVSLFRPPCSRSACLPSEPDLFMPRVFQNLTQNCIRHRPTTATPAARFCLCRSYFQKLKISIWSNQSCGDNSNVPSVSLGNQRKARNENLSICRLERRGGQTLLVGVRDIHFDSTSDVCVWSNTAGGEKKEKKENKKKLAQCHINLQRTIHVVMSTSGKTFQRYQSAAQWYQLRCTL